ncbi:MAG: MBL fold metallo-hydrolase [Lentisphaeria bacterium]|nr:MBL fold metallo-hydrolase [Lentisphaeria bacterium]
MIILDAGTGVRRLGIDLMRRGPAAVSFLLSHAHWDHVIGFPFFRPLYRKGFRLDFYGNTHAQASVRKMLHQTMQAPFFPVDLSRVAADLIFHETCGDCCMVAGIEVKRFPLSHPNGGCGFRLECNGRSLAFFPDNEMTFDHKGGRSFGAYVEFCRGTDVLIHDAEYLPAEYAAFSRGWGHSVYSDTVRLGMEAGAERLILWHINQDRTDEQADEILHCSRQLIAESGSTMVCDMAYTGMTFRV